MYRFLFVGEKKSPRAIEMGVTWKDKRLAAAHLSKAIEALGVNWDDLKFLNVFEDNINEIKSFNGPIIAMGRKVEKELKKHKIPHHYIHHPAARGKIRKIENYKKHVREQIENVLK
jgi:enamine deaminase RidA (YjgF/YER057c/UK114 family)